MLNKGYQLSEITRFDDHYGVSIYAYQGCSIYSYVVSHGSRVLHKLPNTYKYQKSTEIPND